MEHPWGIDYSEEGVVSRNNLYIVNDGAAVKCTPDAPSLAVCIPSRGTIPVETFMALKRLACPINTQVVFMYTSGMMGTSGRDTMAKECVKMGIQFVYFADDDVMPPSDVLYKMMRHMQMDPSIGLITGVYTNKYPPVHPHIYKEPGGAHYWDFSLSPYDPPEDIWGCGAGCLMVRGEALQKMNEPYWSESAANTGTDGIAILGHDLHFCQQVRDVGYRVVMDGSIQCDHFSVDDKVYYRLPKNSPPVQKHRNDKRNDAYWMNWWSVSPHGEGASYGEAVELLKQVITQSGDLTFNVVNIGGGAIAQMTFNLSNGRSTVIPISPMEIEACNNLLLPTSEVYDADVILCFEPEAHRHVPEFEASVVNSNRPVIWITRDSRENDHLLQSQGEWHVYGNEEASNLRDWHFPANLNSLPDSEQSGAVSG